MSDFWFAAVFLFGPLVVAWLHFFWVAALLRLNYERARNA